MTYTKYRSGFTIVEMLVVLLILGILVSLTAFGYRNWQEGLAHRQVQSDVAMAMNAMRNAKNFDVGYPSSIPSTFHESDDVSISYIGGTKTTYCIEGRSTKFDSIIYYGSASSLNPLAGNCNAAYAVGTPSPSISSVTDTSFVVSWAAVPGASTYKVKYGTTSPTTTAGCSNSPCTVSGLTASTQYRVIVTASSAYSTRDSSVVFLMTAARQLKCDAGDTISGTTCSHVYTASYQSGTSGYYYCPNGGTLSGSTCTITSTDSYAATKGACSEYGYDKYGNSVCTTYRYSCPEGGSLSGTTCTRTTSSNYPASYNSGTGGYYYCNSGDTLSGSTCTHKYAGY